MICRIIFVLFALAIVVQSKVHVDDAKNCGVNQKLIDCGPDDKNCTRICGCKPGFVEVGGKDYCIPKDIRCSIKSLLDLVFIIDASSSVSENSFNDIKTFLTEILVQIYSSGNDVRVALIIYGPQNPNIIFLYETEKLCDIIKAVAGLIYIPNESKTNLIDALNIAENVVYSQCNGARIGSIKQTIVISRFTDFQTSDKERLIKGFHAHQNDCRHHLEFVAIDVDVTILKNVHQFNVKTTKELIKIQGDLFEVTCRAEACSHGYQKIGNVCIDINECDSNACHKNSICLNVPGSFVCYCQKDLQYLDKEKGCGTPEDKCPPNRQIIGICDAVTCVAPGNCSNSNGFDFCVCPRGYSYDQKLGCVDVDECVNNPCLQSGKCKNTIGSFECSCAKGFQYNTFLGCVDVDECKDHNACSGSGICFNTIGSYECTCNPGYEYLQDKGCIDIDECKSGKDVCKGDNVMCKNTPGSFECVCPSGYEYRSKGCGDINECLQDGICPPGSSCINYNGGYNCTCNKGFIFNEQNKTCELDKSLDVVQARVDLVFVVDTSDAMKKYLTIVQNMLVNIITDYKLKSLAVIKRYFAVTTGGNSDVKIIFTQEQDSTVLNKTDGIVFTGGTSLLSNGLKAGRQLYLDQGQLNASRLVIAVTATKPSSYSKAEIEAIRQQATEIKRDGRLVIIYVGDNVTNSEWNIIFTEGEIGEYIIAVTQDFISTIHKVIYQNTDRLIKCPDGFVFLDRVCQYKTAAAVYCSFENNLYALNTTWNSSCTVYNCTEKGVVMLDRKCLGFDGDCYKDDQFFPCNANNQLNWRCRCKIYEYYDEIAMKKQQRMDYFIIQFNREEAIANVKLTDPKGKCELPFKYQGEWYYACTDARSYTRWCSNDRYYNNKYSTCASVVSAKCVFNDKVYNEGDKWSVACNNILCSSGQSVITSRCAALNGTCVNLNSDNYPCKVDNDEYASCLCVQDNNGYGKNAGISGKVTGGGSETGGTLVKFCEDKITNVRYEVGKVWTKNCFTLKCTEQGETQTVDKKCEAKDLQCFAPGSADFFTCDMNGQTKEKCQCISENNEIVLIVTVGEKIEKQTIETKKMLSIFRSG